MIFYSRLKSIYKQYRVYNKYSHPLRILFIDLVGLAGKAGAVACALWVCYASATALFGGSLQQTATAAPVAPALSTASTAVAQQSEKNGLSLARLMSDNTEASAEIAPQRSRHVTNAAYIKPDVPARSGQIRLENPTAASSGAANKSDSMVASNKVRVATGGTDTVVANEAWLHQQKPAAYTIQFGTSSNLALLQQFGEGFPQGATIAIYQFERNADTRPIYGIAHGVYQTFEEARDAIVEFPDTLRQYGPWIRPMNQLQRKVRKPEQ